MTNGNSIRVFTIQSVIPFEKFEQQQKKKKGIMSTVPWRNSCQKHLKNILYFLDEDEVELKKNQQFLVFLVVFSPFFSILIEIPFEMFLYISAVVRITQTPR